MPELWIINHYAGFPETVPATRTFELAKHLANQGWKVTVVACSFNHYSFADDFPDRAESVHEQYRDGVRWVFVKGGAYKGNGGARLRNMLEFSGRTWRWSLTQVPPQFVIGTTVHPFAAEVARRIAKRMGAKFVYEITDLWPESLVDLGHIGRRSFTYRVMKGLERRAFKTARGVIGIPPGVADYALDAHGLTLQNFCYIPNGTVAPSPNALVRTEPEMGTIAYAGGFAPAHGMPSIIAAAECLQTSHPGRFTFHLYGDGPDRPALEDLVVKRGVANVQFHGLVPKVRLQEYLVRAEICICSGEALGVHRYGISFNKIFDYFKAARPIVFAVNSGNDPVREAGAGRSVPAGDGEAIARAILYLADLDRAQLNEMGMRGRDYLIREHSFDRLGDRLECFLTGLERSK